MFVREVFTWKYERHLGCRACSFRTVFEYLEARNKDSFCIVETGTMRKEDLPGDGNALLQFDDFVNYYDGRVVSIDIAEDACQHAAERVSRKSQILCGDSVRHLYDMAATREIRIDLIYLDSLDLDWSNPHRAGLHHMKELAAAMPMLGAGSVVLVDDDADGRGKGTYVGSFMVDVGAQRLCRGYQSAWVLI